MGFDAGLNTYFIQVVDRAINDEAMPLRDPIVFWAGTRVGEIQTVEQLRQLIEPLVDLDPGTMNVLREDKSREAHPPTKLQQMMREQILQYPPCEVSAKRNRKFLAEFEQSRLVEK